jgi:flagellar hook-length control protein FliK
VPVVHDVRLAAVPVEIGLKSLSGVNRFEMRLDPPELGRVDVRIDIDEDGGVKTRLLVDRSDTLALLQRDAPQLRHALEQAGLKPNEGSIDLMLRDPTGQGTGEGRGGRDGFDRNQPEPARSGAVTGSEQSAFNRPAPSAYRRDGIDRTV